MVRKKVFTAMKKRFSLAAPELLAADFFLEFQPALHGQRRRKKAAPGHSAGLKMRAREQPAFSLQCIEFRWLFPV